MRIHSVKFLGALSLLADLSSTAWLPWYYDDFTSNSKLEDDYIMEYGNEDVSLYKESKEEPQYQSWTAVRNLYEKSILPPLIRLCAAAHKEAGRGTVGINAVKLNARILTFQNPFYESRWVDVLTYGVKNETDPYNDWWDLVVGPLNYMTEGLRSDCVCYLTLLSSLKMEFSLYEHVCGINVTGITDVEPSRHTTTLSTTTSTSSRRARTTKKSTRKTTKKSATKKSVTKKTTLGKSTLKSTRKTRTKLPNTWS